MTYNARMRCVAWSDLVIATDGNDTQVQELSKLFRESFGFQVERTTLNNTKPPQQQLNAAISNFVLEHDGPYNLLLVYYAGHGQFDEAARQLILAGLVHVDDVA